MILPSNNPGSLCTLTSAGTAKLPISLSAGHTRWPSNPHPPDPSAPDPSACIACAAHLLASASALPLSARPLRRELALYSPMMSRSTDSLATNDSTDLQRLPCCWENCSHDQWGTDNGQQSTSQLRRCPQTVATPGGWAVTQLLVVRAKLCLAPQLAVMQQEIGMRNGDTQQCCVLHIARLFQGLHEGGDGCIPLLCRAGAHRPPAH